MMIWVSVLFYLIIADCCVVCLTLLSFFLFLFFRFLLAFVFSASLVAAVSLIEELCGIWGRVEVFF